MKHSYKTTMLTIAAIAAASASSVVFAEPQTPEGVNAEVFGTRVELSWSNGDAGSPLLECGFEEGSFPAEGWSTKVTNDYKYFCSWFSYPSSDFLQTNNWEEYIHSGEKSAMMYFDMYGYNGDHNAAQDEWLITPVLNGAAYLDLYYYIDPQILEYGADESFPDHYYVKVSYDNGENWEILWDARTQAMSTIGWHNLALPLKPGSPAMVAFQGVSDTQDMVHFLWAIDDVKVMSSKSGSDIVEGYTIKVDGKTVAEHVKSLRYSDVSPKDPGIHKYEIFAESGGNLSRAAETEVTIADIKLLPPNNVKIESIYDEMSESYTISLSWEAPAESEISPAWYNVYCDGYEVGTMIEETAVDFWGYTKGIYDFRVSAVYENPDGESERIGERLAIDTRFNARNLQAKNENGNILLTWDAPEESDAKVDGYEVWRAEKCIGENVTGTSVEDKDVPAGKYRYYVNVIYSDGETTLPAYIDVDNGDCAPHNLPFCENFDSCHLPSDWAIINLWDSTPDNLLWQFGDPNGIGVTGEGFDKGFASIDCINSGFYSVQSALVTPPINIKDCVADKLTVEYSFDYASTGMDSAATLEIEKDGNDDWIPIDELASYDPEQEPGVFKPVKQSVELGEFAKDASTIRLRWNYAGMFDYHLAIDNVTVSDGITDVSTISASDIRVIRTADGIEIEAADGILGVEVFSTDGRLLQSTGANGDTLVNLSLPSVNFYIIRIKTTGAVYTYKLAK